MADGTSIAYLFPGQGSQAVGMGKDIYEASPAARAVFDEANEILGFDIARLCFEGPDDELTLTRNSQPAIFVTSIACLSAFREGADGGPRPVAAAGLSLGEFSAHVAAGSFSFADGLRLVRKRAEAMQEACDITPGTMASIVGLDPEAVECLCRELSDKGVLNVANLNCPGQIVVSGSRDAVQEAMAEAEKRGASRAVELQVSGAFHSALMRPAEEMLREAVEAIAIDRPRFPVVANVSARPTVDPAEIREALVRQLCSPVLWERSVRFMIGEGAETFLEFGHGRVLRGLMRRIDRARTVMNLQDSGSVRKAVEAVRGGGENG